MSLIHRVIILNKPLKIRGFTPLQWVFMTGALGLAFTFFSMVPKEWKIGNLPAGFIVGMIVFCGAMVLVHALEMRPIAWWRNNIFYRLKIVPSVYLPHPEEGQAYPDATIVETERSSEQYYVK